MSREKLREAISDVEVWLSSLTNGRSLVDEEACRTMAAARAYACERCGGDGECTMPGDEKYSTYYVDCPDCADYRKIADGGEV